MKRLWTGLGAASLGLATGCNDDATAGPVCADKDATAVVQAVGTYQYTGALRGTITLEQDTSTVRLTRTTYANADDRPVVGEGALDGNVLTMVLVPENGDTDYTANVTFVFDDGGKTFCVEFSDTNGDEGGLGSYTGVRL